MVRRLWNYMKEESVRHELLSTKKEGSPRTPSCSTPHTVFLRGHHSEIPTPSTGTLAMGIRASVEKTAFLRSLRKARLP